METIKGLKPGMRVINLRSRNTGILIADPRHSKRLYLVGRNRIRVRRDNLLEGHGPEATWPLKNVELKPKRR